MDAEVRGAGKKRKLQGIQQRLAQAEEATTAESAVHALLMTMIAKGIMSGVLAHEFARAAQQDLRGAREGLVYPDLEKLANLAQGRNLIRSVNPRDQRHVGSGAVFFLDLWRKGKLGKVCLDYIPNPEEVQRLRQMRAETEPPGPWGPPAYPEVPEGLELSRRGPYLPPGFQPRSRTSFDANVKKKAAEVVVADDTEDSEEPKNNDKKEAKPEAKQEAKQNKDSKVPHSPFESLKAQAKPQAKPRFSRMSLHTQITVLSRSVGGSGTEALRSGGEHAEDRRNQRPRLAVTIQTRQPHSRPDLRSRWQASEIPTLILPLGTEQLHGLRENHSAEPVDEKWKGLLARVEALAEFCRADSVEDG
eukprot:s830_g21.t1